MTPDSLPSILLADSEKTYFGIFTELPDFGSPEDADAARDSFDWLERPDLARQCTLGHAAVELRKFLCRLVQMDDCNPSHFPWLNRLEGGARMIVVESAEGMSDGFRIRTEYSGGQASLRIIGDSPAGALYGCYHFLELLGCRWVALGRLGEEIPALEQLVLPRLEIQENPAFSLRGFWPDPATFEPSGQRGSFDLFQWMARNRMNFWAVNDAAATPGFLRQRGIRLTCGGPISLHLLSPEGFCDHPEHRGQPLRAAHPDWFGLNEAGQSEFPVASRGSVNFCTSNLEAVHYVVERAVQELANGHWRAAESINLWPQEGGAWCRCAQCQSLGGLTDRYLRLVHQFARGLKEARETGRLHRNVTIYYRLEEETLTPPTRPLPSDFDFEATVPVFVFRGRCYAHSISDPACGEYNRVRNEHFRLWTEFLGGRSTSLCVGEYHNDDRFRDLPLLIPRILAEDIDSYRKMGVTQLHACHVPRSNWGPAALNYHLLARLLWKPDQPLEALLAGYFSDRYGPAGPQVRPLYEQLEKALGNLTAWKFDFVDRVRQGEKKLFVTRHLPFERAESEGKDLPATVADSMRLLLDVSHTVKGVLEVIDDAGDKARLRFLREDYPSIEYAQNTFFFYEAVARAAALVRGSAEWKAVLKEVESWASLLEDQVFVETALGAQSPLGWQNALQASLLEDLYRDWEKGSGG